MAAVLAGLIIYVIRCGIMMEEKESGASETYHEHQISTYNRIKKQVGDIERTQQVTDFSR